MIKIKTKMMTRSPRNARPNTRIAEAGSAVLRESSVVRQGPAAALQRFAVHSPTHAVAIVAVRRPKSVGITLV
jgi:hypothetical protein